MDETRTFELPERVAERVEARLQRTEFDSVDEYVTFVVEEVLAVVEDETGGDAVAVDEAAVRSRLESLGYLE